MSAARRLLIVEDDAKIAALLADYARAEHFDCVIETDGRRAVQQARALAPDAILLDLMLPGLNGVEVCRAIRAFCTAPILMVTAKIEEIDRLIGLDSGADDYICKPFSPKEVMARLRAQRRRAAGLFGAALPYAVDEAAQRIIWGQQCLPLTPVEYRLLRTLMRRPAAVFSRGQLLDALHDDFRDVSERAIDSHIKNIRRKLNEAGAPAEVIGSVYGVGYRLDAQAG